MKWMIFETYLSSAFPTISRTITNNSLFFQDLAPPKICPLKISTRYFYMPSWTDGQSRPIYKTGTPRWISTNILANYLKEWKLQKKSTKAEQLLKLQLGQIPTLPLIEQNKREDKPPRLPTPRRAALTRARQKMQAIQEISRPEGKHSCFVAPVNLHKSAKYWRITPPSTPHSRHTTKDKPATVATRNVVRPSILTAQKKRWTALQIMMYPYQEKLGKTIRHKILRVTRILKFQKRRNAFMGLAA